jgi:hypothetical protein
MRVISSTAPVQRFTVSASIVAAALSSPVVHSRANYSMPLFASALSIAFSTNPDLIIAAFTRKLL